MRAEKYLWNQWTWNSLSSSAHLSCPLELVWNSSLLESLHCLAWNHIYHSSWPTTLANWYNRAIINYLILCFNTIQGTVWKTNEETRSLVSSTLHFGYKYFTHYLQCKFHPTYLISLYVYIYSNMLFYFSSFYVTISCKLLISRTSLTSYWYPTL